MASGRRMYSIDEEERFEHPGERRPTESSKGGLNSDAVLDSWMNGLRTSFGKHKKPPRHEKKGKMTPAPSLVKITNIGSFNQPSRRAPGPPGSRSMFGGLIGDSVDESTGVAKFVLWSVEAIELTGEGLQTDALYRASGNQSRVQFISEQREEAMRETLDNEENVHILTNALKLYFRKLKRPIIEYIDFRTAWQTDSPVEELRILVQGLPAAQRNTLTYFIHHVTKVLDQHEHNNMGLAALGVILGPTLMRLSPNCQDMAGEMKQQNIIVEFLIKESDAIFPHPRDDDESDNEMYKGATEAINVASSASDASDDSDDERTPGVTDYRRSDRAASSHDSSSDEDVDDSTMKVGRRPGIVQHPETDEESQIDNGVPDSPPPQPVKYTKPSNPPPKPPSNIPPNAPHRLPPNPPPGPPPGPPPNSPPSLPPNPPPSLPPNAPNTIYTKNVLQNSGYVNHQNKDGIGAASTSYQPIYTQEPLSRPTSIQRDPYYPKFASQNPNRAGIIPAKSLTSPQSPSSQVINDANLPGYFKIDTYEKHQSRQFSSSNLRMPSNNESEEEMESPIQGGTLKKQQSVETATNRVSQSSATSTTRYQTQEQTQIVTKSSRTTEDAHYKHTSTSSSDNDTDEESNSDQEYETPYKNVATAV